MEDNAQLRNQYFLHSFFKMAMLLLNITKKVITVLESEGYFKSGNLV